MTTSDPISELARKLFAADYAKREAMLREQVIRRVERAIENVDDTRRESLTRLMAEAATNVLLGILSDPPVLEIHPDGREVVRWPDEAPE